MEVRTRFAPSPTGLLHLGSVRTALFTWLFARHEGGKFLLRIEDTDKTRSKKEYEEGIFKSLKWLGLTWDEKEIRQSERLKIYEKYIKILFEKKKAYYCFCTAEELEREQQALLSEGLPPKYGGRCRDLTSEEAEEKLKTTTAVIRFRMPDRVIGFTDLIRGKIEFNAGLSGDVIIAKGPQEPLYNFACAVDDFEMGITHVIRGEEHLSNTPKQIAIQEVLGFPCPHFGHLPLILGPDRKKLSKRFLSASLDDFQTKGYLPEALLNFLVLLGWHPSPDREVINLPEMVKEFEIKRVQKAGAIFNEEKLDWLNAYYIKNLPPETLIERMQLFIPDAWSKDSDFLKRVLLLEQERMKKLSDFSSLGKLFFDLPVYPVSLLSWNKSPYETVKDNLTATKEILEKISEKEFSEKSVTEALKKLTEERGNGNVLWPLRVALSGGQTSPSPFELLEAFGKGESFRRIDVALEKLKQV